MRKRARGASRRLPCVKCGMLRAASVCRADVFAWAVPMPFAFDAAFLVCVCRAMLLTSPVSLQVCRGATTWNN